MSFELDSRTKMYAFEYLGETRESVEKGIVEIRNFIANDAELRNAAISDKLISCFLRSNKFRMERVKKKLKSFYTHRLEIDWFIVRDPFVTTINELLSIGVFLPIHEKDELNRQVVIIRIGAHNPKIHSQNDVMKTSLMVLDWLFFHDPSLSVYGICAIFDMKNVTLGHAMQMTPKIIKQAVHSMESYPTRIQHLHFVNAHAGLNIILDIFRKFMTQKLRERISVTRGNPDNAEYLPSDLGGENKNYQELAAHWKEKLEKNHLFFNKTSELDAIFAHLS